MLPTKFVAPLLHCFCLIFASSVFAAPNPQSGSDMKSFKIINTSITKSPNDPRLYRVIRLQNDLEVLLVSDPDLENSAASLSVPIGSVNNPDKQLGLAHYLEHMLFLGSERYPVINEYSKFMSQHGGYTNAYTAQDRTVYGFEVNDEFLDEALDRLGDVMRAPLLDPKYAEKERHTVNAENETYVDNDMRKLYALQRYTLNPEHPIARFSTGNLTTLVDKPDSKLQDELVHFFNDYYSANLMKVALTGPRSLEQLEQIASQYLNQIPNKNSQQPVISIPMLTDKQRAIKVEIKPTADVKLLEVNFLVPSMKDQYMFQPGGYVSRLLGSDHHGGLSDYLKNAGLIESVMSGFYPSYSKAYSQLTMDFKLTNAGLDNQDKIIASLFSFINLVKEQGVNELQFQEQKKSLDTRFKFLTKQSGFDYVMSLAANMQIYPNQDLLFFPYRLDSFNKVDITKLLNELTPDNVRIFELTPNAKGETQIPFYQGKYTETSISQTTQQAWLEQADNIALSLPRSNKWMPENLALVKKTDSEKAVQLVDKIGHSVWFQQSHYLDEPKASLKLQLNSNIADQSAKSRVVMSLLLNMLNKQFAELNFVTQEAGLNFSVNNENGLQINTSGYSDKQDKLLLQILGDIKHAEFDQRSLELAKQEIERRLNNKVKSKGMNLVLNGFRQVVREPSWSDATLLAEINVITLEDIKQFTNRIFKESTVRLLALGNLSREQVLTLDNALQSIINIQPKPFYKLARISAKTKQGPLNYSLSSELQDDALAVVFLTDKQGDKALATAELLNKFLRPAFYDQIRTQEQLTYSPFSASFPVNDAVAFGLFTQSPVASNAQLYSRFSAFIEGFSELLDAITEDKFIAVKDAHIANYLAKPSSLGSEFSYLSSQWLSLKSNINTKQAFIKSLQNVSLKEVKRFYNDIFLRGKDRQEILVQVQGEKFRGKPLLRLQGEQNITDIDRLPK